MKQRVSLLLQREVFRFGMVGAVNTGLDLGIYFLLHLSGVPVLLANVISTSAGLTFSFVANRVFTFSGRPSHGARRQLAMFVLCTGVGLWVVQPVVIVGMDRLLVAVPALGELRILVAKLVAIAFGMVWNWVLYNKVVFRSGVPAAALVEPGLRPRTVTGPS